MLAFVAGGVRVAGLMRAHLEPWPKNTPKGRPAKLYVRPKGCQVSINISFCFVVPWGFTIFVDDSIQGCAVGGRCAKDMQQEATTPQSCIVILITVNCVMLGQAAAHPAKPGEGGGGGKRTSTHPDLPTACYTDTRGCGTWPTHTLLPSTTGHIIHHGHMRADSPTSLTAHMAPLTSTTLPRLGPTMQLYTTTRFCSQTSSLQQAAMFDVTTQAPPGAVLAHSLRVTSSSRRPAVQSGTVPPCSFEQMCNTLLPILPLPCKGELAGSSGSASTRRTPTPQKSLVNDTYMISPASGAANKRRLHGLL